LAWSAITHWNPPSTFINGQEWNTYPSLSCSAVWPGNNSVLTMTGKWGATSDNSTPHPKIHKSSSTSSPCGGRCDSETRMTLEVKIEDDRSTNCLVPRMTAWSSVLSTLETHLGQLCVFVPLHCQAICFFTNYNCYILSCDSPRILNFYLSV
jgi:hypothetical protein